MNYASPSPSLKSLVLIFYLSIFIFTSSHAESVARVGDKAPDFTLELLEGRTFNLSAALEKTEKVYLFFFSPWCESYVKETFPEMARECTRAREQLLDLYATHHPDSQFIGIGSRFSASSKSVELYRDKFSIPFPLAFDASNEVFNAYKVRHFPTLVLVGSGQLIELRLKGSELDSMPGSK